MPFRGVIRITGAAQTLLFLSAALPVRAQPPATPIPRAASPVAGDSTRTDAIALSLAEAVDRALRLGDEVRQAETNIEATEAQVGIARSSALPQVRLAGSYQHDQPPRRARRQRSTSS